MENYDLVYKKEYDPFTKFWEVNFYTNRSVKTYIAKFYKEEYADLFLNEITKEDQYNDII